MLYQLGPLTFDTPGPMNADRVSEEFGSDFAVKAVVGAKQPRENMGPADHKFTLSGELLPYFHARTGVGSELGALATLQAMAETGEPQILVRGDGTNMGWWLIEKGSIKSTNLSSRGIGNTITYDVNLVESPTAASAGSIVGLIKQLFS